MKYPSHNPKQVEYIQQRTKTDCGIACLAMLTDNLYSTIKEIIGKNKRGGMYPDDVLEYLEDLGYEYLEVKNLLKAKVALVALQWKAPGLSGHYIVWDGKRKQFLDPINGVIDKKEMLKFAKIDYIWEIIKEGK